MTLIFLLFIALAAAQDQTGTISGTVVDAVTRQPVKQAIVSVNGFGPVVNGPLQGHAATADATGAFTLDSLPAGQYGVGAWNQKYQSVRQVQKHVEVKAGETTGSVTLELIPGAIVSGRVLDEDGEPLQGCLVLGAKNANQGTAAGNSRETGEYRIFGMQPGKYVLSAQCGTPVFEARPFSSGPDPPPSLAYPVQYYPLATDAKSAQMVELDAGSEKSGIDFQMRTAPVTQVHGSFSPAGADWHGRSNFTVQLFRADPSTTGAAVPMNLDLAKGTFDFRQVFPGSYFLTAFTQGNGEDRIGAVARIEVKDRPVETVLELKRGVDISGTVELEQSNGATKIQLNQIGVQLVPDLRVGMPGAFAQVNEDGTLTLKSVLSATWRLIVNGPGIFAKSAWLGTMDVTSGSFDLPSGAAGPLRIVLSTNLGTISGTAPAGQMVFAMALDFPDRVGRAEQADQTGHFTLPEVPPGKYRVFAVDQGSPPEEGGQEVTVHEGETVTIDVKPSTAQ